MERKKKGNIEEREEKPRCFETNSKVSFLRSPHLFFFSFCLFFIVSIRSYHDFLFSFISPQPPSTHPSIFTNRTFVFRACRFPSYASFPVAAAPPRCLVVAVSGLATPNVIYRLSIKTSLNRSTTLFRLTGRHSFSKRDACKQ